MAKTYLDETGLATLWGKIKTYVTNAAGVTNVAYDSTNTKFTKTINGTTSDIVTLSTLKTAMSLNNVDNTSDANKSVASAAKLTTAVNINGITFDGSQSIIFSGVCNTASSTDAKEVTITNYNDAEGNIIFVRFANVSVGTNNITLKVNTGSALPIYKYSTTRLTAADLSQANITLALVRTSSGWQLIGENYGTYSNMTQAQATAGALTSGMLISPKVLSTTISNAIGESETAYETMSQAQATAGTITYGMVISPKVLSTTISNAIDGAEDHIVDMASAFQSSNSRVVIQHAYAYGTVINLEVGILRSASWGAGSSNDISSTITSACLPIVTSYTSHMWSNGAVRGTLEGIGTSASVSSTTVTFRNSSGGSISASSGNYINMTFSYIYNDGTL